MGELLLQPVLVRGRRGEAQATSGLSPVQDEGGEVRRRRPQIARGLSGLQLDIRLVYFD